jgi:hypothetical protein
VCQRISGYRKSVELLTWSIAESSEENRPSPRASEVVNWRYAWMNPNITLKAARIRCYVHPDKKEVGRRGGGVRSRRWRRSACKSARTPRRSRSGLPMPCSPTASNGPAPVSLIAGQIRRSHLRGAARPDADGAWQTSGRSPMARAAAAVADRYAELARRAHQLYSRSDRVTSVG